MQDRGEDKDARAADEIVPKVTDIECEEENEHERLRDDGGKENRRAAHVAQEKRDQEKSENAAVKNGAENVAGFDQVFDQAGERRDGDRDQSPDRRQEPASRRRSDDRSR